MKSSMRSRLEHLCHRLIEVDAMLAEPDTASDMDRFRKLSRERAELEPVVEAFNAFVRSEEDLATAQEMLSDPDMKAMAEEEIKASRGKIEELEGALQLLLLPRDPNDGRSLFLEIRAGTGGDESALFSGDLLRMYTRYAEQRGWRVELMSESPSELGATKEVIARIDGDGAYGRLKFESGAHRVQRVPATEAQGRIHTSACTVAIMAEADEVSRSSSTPATCASTPSAPAAPAGSTSTRPIRPCALPTCRPGWWWNARTTARSTATRTRPCRCWPRA